MQTKIEAKMSGTYIKEVDVEDQEVEGEGEGHGEQQPDVALKEQY